VIATEKHVEVRRGAVFVVLLLFKSVGKDILSLFSEQELLQITKQLQIVKERDFDVLTSQHAADSLEILNELFISNAINK